MTYTGHIEAGKVVFDEPAPLVDGTRVRIEVVAAQQDTPTSAASPSLADQLAEIIGKAEQLPADWSENHDHYLKDENSLPTKMKSREFHDNITDTNAIGAEST